jgi:branched-chain amino acid transport system ATP-binding protein
MLEVEGIVAGYGRITALHGVHLAVEPRSVVALLGANGAGKSTTLNCICGTVPVRSGSIRFQGERIDRLPPHQIVARGIAQVPEGREIFARMSVRENLEIGAHRRRDHAAIRNDMERILEDFPVLRQRLRQMAGTLSGGEQQMLLVARALMAAPSLLMIDEPSLGLSPVMVEQIFAIVERISAGGMTVLLVEQNAQLALEVAAAAYVLENGEIVAHAPSAELLQSATLRRAYLG